MKINKAVITAAAPDQPRLPLQSLVDKNGDDRTSLQLIVEEVIHAGVEEICIVVRPGDHQSYAAAAVDHAQRLEFIEQDDPKGYADALLRAKDFVGEDPFLHLIGDHIYLSNTERCCAAQLIDIASREECAVSAVQATRERMLPYFGTVGANRIAQQNRLFQVKRVIEKPTPTVAEQELVVAGLRSGLYLCIFGMHVLTPAFMEILQQQSDADGPTHISNALSTLAEREQYLAYELEGSRFNIGVKYGLLRAQLEMALAGNDRDMILTELVEILARRGGTGVASTGATS